MHMDESDKIKRRYNRYSYLYDLFESLPEKLFFAKYRKEIIPKLRGKVLEIGVGTGKNLPYYSGATEVTAVDFSDKMLNKAKEKLKRLNKNNIKFQLADVQNLPFSDNSFDFVVATFVFCSVPDPIKGFSEVKRVLKDSGQAIFLEHVKSKNKLRGKLQEISNPLTVGLFGFNINRETQKNIVRGGLNITQDKHLAMDDIIRVFECKKTNL